MPEWMSPLGRPCALKVSLPCLHKYATTDATVQDAAWDPSRMDGGREVAPPVASGIQISFCPPFFLTEEKPSSSHTFKPKPSTAPAAATTLNV